MIVEQDSIRISVLVRLVLGKDTLVHAIRVNTATMQKVVRSFFANDPKPKDPEKEKKLIKTESRNLKIKPKSPYK